MPNQPIPEHNAAPPPGAERIAQVRIAQRRQDLIRIGILLLILFSGFFVRVLLGGYQISFPDFFRILSGTNIPGATFILMESKLPRAILGVLAGAAFGLSGSLSQTLFRNPLASPDILGISMAASAGAVLTLVVGGHSGVLVTAAAFGSAVVVVIIIVALGGLRNPDPMRIIVAGIACGMLLSAVVQWAILKANIFQLQTALVWLTGSLNAIPWDLIALIAIILGVLIAPALYLHHRVRLLSHGESLAGAWGVAIPRTRVSTLIVVAALCGAVTSVTGPIAFVALLAGPIARQLHGGRPHPMSAALVGAIIVVIADFLGAYAIPNTNLPVGVVTGLAGSAALLWLVFRQRSVRN